MDYLTGEILICLLIAALAGASIAWLLRGVRWRSREAELIKELKSKVSALDQAEIKLAELNSTKMDLQTQLNGEKDRTQSLAHELEQTERAMRERENEVSRVEANLVKLKQEKNSDINRLQGKITSMEALITRLQGRETEIVKPIEQMNDRLDGDRNAPEKGKDDLKKIFGIGPVLEKTLNKLGIHAYEQIARFTPQDVERVSRALEFFPGRIERDDWIGSAQKQYRAKYGKSI